MVVSLLERERKKTVEEVPECRPHFSGTECFRICRVFNSQSVKHIHTHPMDVIQMYLCKMRADIAYKCIVLFDEAKMNILQ